MWLIIGLGNPGESYAQTRHNIGFQCVAQLAKRHGLEFRGKRAHARIAEGHILGQRVVLAKPITYMNVSGRAVAGLCHWYKVDARRDLIIIYDDLDLPPGKLRLRQQGSAGTHNGMRSIVQHLGHQEFARLRVGIGSPPPGWETTKYVLGRFGKEEAAMLPDIYERVSDAIERVIRDGVALAMNHVNAGITPPPSAEASAQETK